MSDKRNTHKIRKKILMLLSLIFAIVIAISFLYNFVELAMKPTNIYIVENRQNI